MHDFTTFIFGAFFVVSFMAIIYTLFPKLYFITVNNQPLNRLSIFVQVAWFAVVVLLIFGLTAPQPDPDPEKVDLTPFFIGLLLPIGLVILGIYKKYNIVRNESETPNFPEMTVNKDQFVSDPVQDALKSKLGVKNNATSAHEFGTDQDRPVVVTKAPEPKKDIKEFASSDKQENIKLNNVFLGFVEGIFIDGKINTLELEALIRWIERYPEATEIKGFENILQIVDDVVKHPNKLNEKYNEIIKVLNLFKNTDFYIQSTADSQWLHGLLAGIVCDKTLNVDEVRLLNQWLKDNDHIEDDPIYIDLFEKLKPFRLTKSVDDAVVKDILKSIQKYVSYDDYGLPVTAVTSSKDDANPDFYHGEFSIDGFSFCFTGASSRFTKAEWQSVVESNQGTFAKNMTKSVDYLVVCNKGNAKWAHMSYGRKFEQALKWQRDGVNILILTEDDFVRELGLSE